MRSRRLYIGDRRHISLYHLRDEAIFLVRRVFPPFNLGKNDEAILPNIDVGSLDPDEVCGLFIAWIFDVTLS